MRQHEITTSLYGGRPPILPMDFTLPPELADSIVMLDFDTPSRDELKEDYERLLTALPSAKRPKYTEAEVDRVVSAGQGMTAMEFENSVSRAIIENRSALPDLPIDKFLGVLLDVKTEVVKRSDCLELLQADKIENVGGLDALKEYINEAKVAFEPEAWKQGVDKPKGIALVGPPGNSWGATP